jgi:hypothetical protein
VATTQSVQDVADNIWQVLMNRLGEELDGRTERAAALAIIRERIERLEDSDYFNPAAAEGDGE